MKTHMTIKEASKLAGKHPDTIRALIRGNKEQSLKDSKGRVLISTAFLMSHYSISTDTKQSVVTTEQVNPATTEQVANKATEQATEGHRTGVNDTTSQLIKALTTELAAKNEIIRQQQETIQQVVNQQQQLTGMLMNRNQGADNMLAGGDNDSMDIYGKSLEKNGENAAESTSVNPIEGKAKEGKVKKEKEIKGKAHSTNKKKRWWNR